MAKVRGELIKRGRTTFNEIYNKVLELDPQQYTVGNANKAWRGLILYNRNKSGNTKDSSVTKVGIDPADGSNVRDKRIAREKVIAEGITTVSSDGTIRVLGKPSELRRNESLSLTLDETLSGINQMNKPKNKVIIYNLSTSPYQYIELQVRPQLVDFKGETSWASIKSMGRNTPMYHYTGAEDTVQFNTSWFRTDPDYPDEVINKCRVLESWSKSDGYKSSPPILLIQWGGLSTDSLFDGQTFILISATYTLKNFNDTARVWDSNKGTLTNNLKDSKLYPDTATQELIFKRVSASNLEYKDIISVGNFNRTIGTV